MTIYLSPKDIQLDRNVIWRDVGFYILSTLVIIGFGLYGELSIISAITLLSMYVLMVIVVYIQEKGDKVQQIRNQLYIFNRKQRKTVKKRMINRSRSMIKMRKREKNKSGLKTWRIKT